MCGKLLLCGFGGAATGEYVVIAWSGGGTHLDDLMGIPPTGKQVTITATGILSTIGRSARPSWPPSLI